MLTFNQTTHAEVSSYFLDGLIDLHCFVGEAQPRDNQPLLLQFFQLRHYPHVCIVKLLLDGAAYCAVAVFPLDLNQGGRMCVMDVFTRSEAGSDLST